MLIGLTGRAGSGKDTVGDYLVAKYGGCKIAFAGPLKAACKVLFQLSELQLHDRIQKEAVDDRWGKSPRQLMQEVGTDLLRAHVDESIFVKSAQYGIEAALARGEPLVVLTDCRFENETKLVRELGGIVWHLRRNRGGVVSPPAHVSEIGLTELPSDDRVENDGSVEELYATVGTLYKATIAARRSPSIESRCPTQNSMTY